MQMTESRRGCTPAQQNSTLVILSHAFRVSQLLMQSFSFPCIQLKQTHFLVATVAFPLDSQELLKFLEKAWTPFSS